MKMSTKSKKIYSDLLEFKQERRNLCEIGVNLFSDEENLWNSA